MYLTKLITIVIIFFCIGVSSVWAQPDYSEADRIGADYAHKVADAVGDEGGVIVLRHKIDAFFSERIVESFLSVIVTEYPHINILVSDFHTGNTVSSAKKIASRLLHSYGAEACIVFAPNRTSFQGAVQAIEEMNLSLDVVGFNDDTADRMPSYVPEPFRMRSDSNSEVRRVPENIFIVPELNLQMREFVHGNGAEKFCLGLFEVTQAQWEKVMGTNPSRYLDPDRPVENISWLDAVAFCRKLTEIERSAARLPEGYVYTLPTEAQWNLASGFDENTWTDDKKVTHASLDSIAWYGRNSMDSVLMPDSSGYFRMATHRVGTKCSNRYGIYDMLGNVNEWCLDGTESGTSTSDDRFRILKGGCWWADPAACCFPCRHRAPKDRRHSALGFRLALSKENENTNSKL